MGSRWELARDGVEVVPSLVDHELLAHLLESCPDGAAGVRDPLCGWDAGCRAARVAADQLAARFGRRPILTRAILFDKRGDANWHLPMHQDLVVAVAERVEAVGFGPWSVKHGRPHVTPPAGVLAEMVTVRLHLDAADERNGCLRVVPGSHLRGRVDPERLDTAPGSGVPIIVGAGDAVLMKPLVLHGSERSTSGARRRVLHLEFAFGHLPAPLRWEPVSTASPIA